MIFWPSEKRGCNFSWKSNEEKEEEEDDDK